MAVPLSRGARASSSVSVCHNSHCAVSRGLLQVRRLNTSHPREATPLPHPTVPGPPPQAPQAAATFPQDRVARKKQQAEALRQSQQSKANPAKPITALQKRFWKDVSVKDTTDGLQIYLDTRPVRTAQRQVLSLPKSKRALACAIALEWDQLVSAQQALKQHYIPLTSITSRAFDIRNADREHGVGGENSTVRQSIVRMAMRYLGTDTLLCWAPEKDLHSPDQPGKKPLRHRQMEVAEPIIAYLTSHIFPGIEIKPILSEDSIMPLPQPEMTLQVIRGWISGLPAFELAALERGVLATKSLLVAVRLIVEWSSQFGHVRTSPSETDEMQEEIDKNRFGIERAAEAASLEVLHQTEQWGEVEDTHDVDREDLRRQLGSAILIVT